MPFKILFFSFIFPNKCFNCKIFSLFPIINIIDLVNLFLLYIVHVRETKITGLGAASSKSKSIKLNVIMGFFKRKLIKINK